MTRGCSEKSKSIKRATIEDGFAEILQALQPTRQLFDLVKAMMVDAWEARLKSVTDGQVETKRQLKATNKQMESLLDRIVEADSPAVISAYEARLGKLEREKIVLTEKVQFVVPPKGRLEECIELALKFLLSPWDIYKNSSYEMRQLVLRLASVEPVEYCRNGGYGTPKFSLPFSILTKIHDQKSEMVL